MVEPSQVVASGAQTANGTSSVILMTTNSMLGALIDTTAGSSISHLSMWAQGSNDQNTWFDAVATWTLKSAAAYAEETARTNVRNIINDKTTTTAETFAALYSHFPWKYARLRWYGTFTSVTFSAWLSSK